MTLEITKNLLSNHQNKIQNSKILCIGDIILDQYVTGSVNRMSPEAPVPIFLSDSEQYQIGGAGNVANNIIGIGAKVTLIYLSGKDTSSKIVNHLLTLKKNVKVEKVYSKIFTTPLKIRYIKNSHQIIRVDKEDINFKLSLKIENSILQKIKKNIMKHDIVLISDYGKGLFSKRMIKSIVTIAKNNKKMIIADPKNNDLSIYSNINIITPNQKEITDSSKKNKLNEHELKVFARKIIKKNKIENILITRSEKGMLLINHKYVKKIKSNATMVNDVTGAGDTVIAILSIMLTLGFDIINSSIIANYAAGLVIKKRGTEAISFNELVQ